MKNPYDVGEYQNSPELRARLRARRDNWMRDPKVLETLERVLEMQRLTAEDLSLTVR